MALFFFFVLFFFCNFFIASKTHTEKKIHRINKVIKKQTNKQKTKTKKTNSEFTHLTGNILTNIKLTLQ